MHFKIAISKRGVTCRMCGGLIKKGVKYFVLFDFVRKEMRYPHIENICLDCTMQINNSSFLYYIERLLKALRNNQRQVNDLNRERDNGQMEMFK